jgi:hypothetical protein
MASAARTSGLRKFFDEQFARVIPDLETYFESEMASFVSASQRENTAALNQAIRRLKQSNGFDETAATLADVSAPYSRHAVVFQLNGETVSARATRGIGQDCHERLRSIEAPLAGAFRTAVETGDPVVALGTASEVSAEISGALAHESSAKASLFPIDRRGVLYAWDGVEADALELLAQVAGLVIPPVPAPALAGLTVIAPTSQLSQRPTWEALESSERRVHLRAQQFARTEVARIRLNRSAAVKEGRSSAGLYTVLQDEIDAMRDAFREKFLSAAPTMVDYLHLELLRTLANDDPAILGAAYPGPLA